MLLLMLAVGAAPAADSKLAELWVDAFALAPGDGTQGNPYPSLDLALSKLPPNGGRIFLGKGLYRGP